MKNVLITGGAGFIGANFVRYLLRVEPSVHILNLDALTYAGSKKNLLSLPDPARHHFIQGDICDHDLVADIFREYKVDTIIHFAAESHVDRSILGPEQFIQTNVMGTFSLLESARSFWHSQQPPAGEKRFHHISTDEVYGSLNPGEPSFTECTPYAPNSPYAASKAASDHLVRAYAHTYGLPATISNCSNNYGPYQFPEKLIPLILLNARAGRSLPVYGDGLQVRDWLFVEDHCEAIQKILSHGTPGETYNIGGDNQPNNLAIVHKICALLDERFPDSPHVPHAQLIVHVSDRPGHDRRYAMDITKINRELGWQPRHTLVAGLEKTVDWYLSQQDWVKEIRKRGDYREWVDANYDQREEVL